MVADEKEDNNKGQISDVEKQQEAVSCKNSAAGQKQQDDDDLGKVKVKKPPGVNASLVAFYGIFSCMFIIGWINLNSCPANIMIPIYLIVAGALGALTKLLSTLEHPYLYNLSMVLFFLALIWHILGSYWVYREYQPNYEASKGKYCNRTAYLLAFWSITFQYTILVLFVTLAACHMLMRNEFNKLED